MKSFENWCIENKMDTLLKLYNDGENIKKANDIGFSSPKPVNWKCKKCGMSWVQSLNKTTRKVNKECPYCTLRRASYFHNVITELPVLGAEWDYSKNIKAPTEYLPSSKETVFWKCRNGHTWSDKISDRVRAVKKNIKLMKDTCPFCNHQKISSSYNFVTEFPNFAKEWNYTMNGSLTPFDVHPMSGKKVWWVCQYNSKHVWQDYIRNRTALDRGCPICSKIYKTSFPARALYYYLKLYFQDCELEYKILGKYTLDIFIPSHKIAIEYDGWYYHNSEVSKKRDEEKDEALKKEGIRVFRIKEQDKDTKNIEVINNRDILFYYERNYNNLAQLIAKVTALIGSVTKENIILDIDVKRDYLNIETLYYHIRKSNSVAVKTPHLVKEWSSKNAVLPDSVTLGSGYRALWICPNCKREYRASVSNRVRKNSGCKHCSIERRKNSQKHE